MRISDWSSDLCSSDLREGANVYRIAVQDVSQGGVKVRSDAALATNAEIVVTLPGLEPQRGIVCWHHQGMVGLRSEERSVGHECVSTCRSRWSPNSTIKKTCDKIQRNNYNTTNK